MGSTDAAPRLLEDVSVPLRLKLSALWASTMFLFAFGDIFSGYRTDIIEDLRSGELGGFEVSQAFLLATSIYVAIPSLMVFLSLVLRPALNRRTNIVLRSVYAVTVRARRSSARAGRTSSSSVSWRSRS